jgi:hypothetical protein
MAKPGFSLRTDRTKDPFASSSVAHRRSPIIMDEWVFTWVPVYSIFDSWAERTNVFSSGLSVMYHSPMSKDDVAQRPTDEALGQYESWREEPVSAAAGAKKRVRRLDASEIDRLFLKGALTQDQHHTLELFTNDLYSAGMVFCPKAGFLPGSGGGGAQFIGDNAFRRVKRVDRQMDLLGQSFNLGAKMIVLTALTDDRRVSPKNEALISAAADVLAEVYDPRSRR